MGWPLESQTATSPYFSFFHSSFVSFFVCSIPGFNLSTFLQTSELKGSLLTMRSKKSVKTHLLLSSVCCG